MNKIVNDYEHLGSLQAVAEKNNISESKVKKTLITQSFLIQIISV